MDVRSDMKANHHVSGPLRNFRLTEEGRKKARLLAAGNFDVQANVRNNHLNSHLKGRLAEADLQHLMVDKHYITSADADLELRSDLKNTYAVNGYVGNLRLNELRKGGQVSLAEGSFNVDATMRGKRWMPSVNGLFPHVGPLSARHR